MLQPEAELFGQHSLICSSGVVQVEPDIPFKILIANFSDIPRKISKGQVVATILLHSIRVSPSTVTIAKVLGILDADETSSISDESAPTVASLPSATPPSDRPPAVDDIDVSHISPERQALVRNMLSKYDTM